MERIVFGNPHTSHWRLVVEGASKREHVVVVSGQLHSEFRFGPVVAKLVDGLTDTLEDPKPDWRPRKDAYLKRLAGEPESVLRVSIADKLHNIRSIAIDLDTDGEAAWERSQRRPRRAGLAAPLAARDLRDIAQPVAQPSGVPTARADGLRLRTVGRSGAGDQDSSPSAGLSVGAGDDGGSGDGDASLAEDSLDWACTRVAASCTAAVAALPTASRSSWMLLPNVPISSFVPADALSSAMDAFRSVTALLSSPIDLVTPLRSTDAAATGARGCQWSRIASRACWETVPGCRRSHPARRRRTA